jgi:predicted nucleotidyltransferase
MIQQDLSEKLKIAVDLVSEKSLKNQRLIKSIQADLITIYDDNIKFAN